MLMTAKQLNQYISRTNLTAIEVTELKKTRRRLKNREYSKTSRGRKGRTVSPSEEDGEGDGDGDGDDDSSSLDLPALLRDDLHALRSLLPSTATNHHTL